MGGEVNASNIKLSDLQTAYNNVNNAPDLTNPTSLSEFRGCELVDLGVSGSKSFSYTGSVQTYAIPAGVTSIHVQCWGADGGSGGYFSYSGASSPGGTGGYAEGDVAVSSGQTVYIYVGGRGYNWYQGGNTGNNGVFVGIGRPSSSSIANGGESGGGVGFGQGGRATKYGMAGGGAASHIRLNGIGTNDRQIIAGGGGGGGNSQSSTVLGGGGAGGGLTGQTMAVNTQYASRNPGIGGEAYAGTDADGSWSSTMDGNAHSNDTSIDNIQGGGGGGFFGGGQKDNSTGGGGGSGWIGGTAVTNGKMYSGKGLNVVNPIPPSLSNPSNVPALTGDIDGLKHGHIKFSYGSQTLSNVPVSGPISIDSDFKGKTFKDMSPNMTITAGIANNTSTSNASTTITFTSSEPTIDFNASSVTINMGTLTSPFVPSGDNKIFTSTLTFNTSNPPNPHTIDVLPGVYTNSKTPSIGCKNNAATQYAIAYSTTVPIGEKGNVDTAGSPWLLFTGSKGTGNETSRYGFEIDLSSASYIGASLVNGNKGHVFFRYVSGTSFRQDPQLYEVDFDGNGSATVGYISAPPWGYGGWKTSSMTTNESYIHTAQPWYTVNASTSPSGMWHRDIGGTVSSGTGVVKDYHIYMEGSSPAYNKDIYLRSPEITFNTNIIKFSMYGYGINIGKMYLGVFITA